MNSKLGLTGVSILFVLATLAGCGGGGDGSVSAAAPPPNDAAAAPPPNNAPNFAYVANSDSGNVSAYAINASTGALSEVAGSPFAAGTQPTSVSVDPSGKFAYVANYSGFEPGSPLGSVSAYTINATTGALTSIGAAVAAGSGSRSVAVDPSGKFAYVANGEFHAISTDNVLAYAINGTTGALSEVAGSPFKAGTNPSSVTVDPSGKFAYVANQASGDVWAYTINAATGALISIGTPVAAGIAYDVTVDPSGKFAYVANGNSDNVSAYTINASTGALSEVAGSPFAAGTLPASVTVDPSGKFAYVANFTSNDLSAYTINATTGALTSIGTSAATGTGPNSITVDPSGKFAYVTNSASDNVSVYTINAATGALTSVGAPVAAGSGPTSVTTTGTIR